MDRRRWTGDEHEVAKTPSPTRNRTAAKEFYNATLAPHWAGLARTNKKNSQVLKATRATTQMDSLTESERPPLKQKRQALDK